LANGTWPED
jgi:hypothetical protein